MKMKPVIVTGTPGTGKTTLARECARRFNLEYIDVNKVIKNNKLSEYYDSRMGCDVVDSDKLNSALLELIKMPGKRLIIDSHMSHYLPKEQVQLCIVTKCSLPELKKRLEHRGYGKEKVRENLDAEIFDICLVEAADNGHDIIVIETDIEIDYGMIESILKKEDKKAQMTGRS